MGKFGKISGQNREKFGKINGKNSGKKRETFGNKKREISGKGLIPLPADFDPDPIPSR